MSLNIDMNMILPVKFSGVSPNFNSKLLTSPLSCKRISKMLLIVTRRLLLGILDAGRVHKARVKSTSGVVR